MFFSRSHLALSRPLLLLSPLLALLAASSFIKTPSAVAATSSTFTYTGTEQTYVVPQGVAGIEVTAVGAPGGATNGSDPYNSASSPGGEGATVTADLSVTPGETLYVYVGGAGAADDHSGGFNGGGPSSDLGAASGGGASDVRTAEGDLTTRLIVAGGGGGGGSSFDASPSGGSAGDPAGVSGAGDSSFSDTGGGGGTQTGGGAGGSGEGGSGTDGSFGQGGTGTDFAGDPVTDFSGGGGGGGYYGGGGGSSLAGGGGGSDYVEASATNASFGLDTTGTPEVTMTPLGPIFSANPSPVAFGNVGTGNQGTETVTITNNGGQPLNLGSSTITGDNPADFSVLTDGCSGQVLNGGDTCQDTVAFEPSQAAAEDAVLNIPDNTGAGGTANTDQVVLNGTGIAPATFSTDTNSYDFGNQDQGASSTSHTVTITNSGDTSMNIGQLSLAGANPAQFTLSADTCSSAALAGGDSCTVAVAFTPGAQSRAAQSAELVVPDNASNADGNGDNTIDLSGDATAPAAVSTASSLPFGSVLTHTGATKTVTITNKGDDVLNIGTLSISGSNAGDFALSSDTCSGATVAGGSSCTVGVTFVPGQAGDATAELSVPSNDPSSTTTVGLTGTGTMTPLLAKAFVKVIKMHRQTVATLLSKGEAVKLHANKAGVIAVRLFAYGRAIARGAGHPVGAKPWMKVAVSRTVMVSFTTAGTKTVTIKILGKYGKDLAAAAPLVLGAQVGATPSGHGGAPRKIQIL